MSAAATVSIILIITSVVLTLCDHGKPKKENWSVWKSLISALIWSGLLYWGGFFN
jgi:hypothetical protein